jgi:catechol 2,3-dioxygenase-like lactoylglutathione lyase family enzyme
MKHLALAVSDQQRSRRFYETYFGFDAQPGRRYDDNVLMLYNRDGFSLALAKTDESIRLPKFLHFGIGEYRFHGVPWADGAARARANQLTAASAVCRCWAGLHTRTEE